MIEKKKILLLYKIRNLGEGFLSLDNSPISIDLILKISLAHYENRNLTIKSLFSELSHSEMALRIHLKKIINDDWVVLKTSTTDGRAKLVYPSTKLINNLKLFDIEFGKIIQTYINDSSS